MRGGMNALDDFCSTVGATTLRATSTFVENIVDDAGITLGLNANLTGRALDFATKVTMDANTITVPTCVPVPPSGRVTVGKSFSPSAINPVGTSALTITLSSNNAVVATLNADFADNLPSGVTTVGVPGLFIS
jgi:hypothetical protein